MGLGSEDLTFDPMTRFVDESTTKDLFHSLVITEYPIPESNVSLQEPANGGVEIARFIYT
jgi:hypothetical protein